MSVAFWLGGATPFKALLDSLARRLTADGKEQELVETADDYVRLLKERFGLDLPQTASLWPNICARHEALFGEQAAS